MIMISPSFACIPAPLHLKGPTYAGYTYNTYHMYSFCCCNLAFSPIHATSGLLRHPFLSFGSSYSLMHVLKGKYISVHSGSEIHTLVHNHMDRPQDAYPRNPTPTMMPPLLALRCICFVLATSCLPDNSTIGLLGHHFLSFGNSYSLMHMLKGRYTSVHSGSENYNLVHNHMDRPQDAYQSKPNTNNDATTISTAVYFRAEVLNFMAFFSCTFPFSMFEVCATACKT